MTLLDDQKAANLSRRTMLQAGAGLLGGAMLLWSALQPSRPTTRRSGTWPAGSQGDTVYVGAAVPLTGTYALQGADELKGWQLAVEHINGGHELMKALAPKVDKGLLGKKVELLSADSAAKPRSGR
ncbi:ABC transporter substrate-binding protein [Mesorhizobium atlanticum]